MLTPDIKNVFDNMCNIHYCQGPVYKEKHKKAAYLKSAENELESIYHLTESHSPSFRYNASLLYERCCEKVDLKVLPLAKSNFTFKCSNVSLMSQIEDMLNQVEEMPKEWTVIQLTSSFNLQESLQVVPNKVFTNPLHITVFNCGQSKVEPVSVRVGVPRDNSGHKIELLEQIDKIISDSKSSLAKLTKFKNSKEKIAYAEFKHQLNDSLESAVNAVQDRWLKEWRILLLGKYVNQELEDEIDSMLEELLEKFSLKSKISVKSKTLLRIIIKGQSFLDLMEVSKAIEYCLPDIEKRLRSSITQHIRNEFSKFLRNANKRHPVILIVEESIDMVPWEMVDVLIEQPASRMQSLHMLYALYKEHEGDMLDGYKINLDSSKGTYILNPGLDLVRMETRLSSFFRYWTPGWKFIRGKTPTTEEFVDLITSGDIFSYNGHGDGFKFITGNDLQKLRVNGVILLFGCSSVQLQMQGPQCEHFGWHQHYLMACSPCIVGMLWTVTDTDTDLLSTDFISRWVPSDAPCHWGNLDKKKWLNEEADVKSLPKTGNSNIPHEPELLTALLKSRKAACQYLNQAACVARGIPVKLIWNKS